MASDRNVVTTSGPALRKIMKPVISTDVMGNRNVEVKAVGARAEPAVIHSEIIHRDYCDAVRAAEVEQEKIRVMQEEKAARLKRFQEDVKKRVRQINKTKRKQQLHNDYQSMEKHHNQVRSSLKAADCLTERKDRLISRTVPVVAVSGQPSSIAPPTFLPGEEVERTGQSEMFESHNHKVHTFTSEARQKLSNRRVEGDIFDNDDLSGGKWITYDSTAELVKKHTVPDDDGDDTEDDNDGNEDQVNDLYTQYQGGRQNSDRFNQNRNSDLFNSCSFPAAQTLAANGNYGHSEKEKEDDDEEKEKDSEDEKGYEENSSAYHARLQRVKFNLRTVEVRNPVLHQPRKVSRKKVSGSRPTSAPDLRAGATEYAERRRQEQQKLNYRRLYSDLERQAVRDNQRRKQQRSQIQKIKKEKEELRRQAEDDARRLVEPRDPVTGETSVESNLRQQLERSHLQEVLQEREERRQKEREMVRYLEALRNNLREKLNKRGLELPALCCCGETLWDTHPDTCANNCFYYRNHRAYARALQSLLTSSEVV